MDGLITESRATTSSLPEVMQIHDAQELRRVIVASGRRLALGAGVRVTEGVPRPAPIIHRGLPDVVPTKQCRWRCRPSSQSAVGAKPCDRVETARYTRGMERVQLMWKEKVGQGPLMATEIHGMPPPRTVRSLGGSGLTIRAHWIEGSRVRWTERLTRGVPKVVTQVY